MREFTLEDLDEFVGLDSEEETALMGDKQKLCIGVHMCFARQTDTKSTVMAQAGNGHKNSPNDHLLLGNGGWVSSSINKRVVRVKQPDDLLIFRG